MKDSTKVRLEKLSEFTVVPLIAIVIGLLIQSCGDSRTYDDGYNDGYSVGKEDGYDVGYKNGYEDGQKDSKNGFDATAYYVTDYNFYFHCPDCELLGFPSNQYSITYDDRESLIDKGYNPCKTCNP
ncbi:hypothetical protein SAMN02910292_02896 [Lachnospiraceae bacterium XBB2008]|nr:hypothetical protein SAMN02910292_02896 [Lachnospiraceae bacterium XBB2008]